MNGPAGYDVPSLAVPTYHGPPGYGPMPVAAAPRCSNCRFFGGTVLTGNKYATSGTCHRFPPLGKWLPQTHRNHWCGEFSWKPQG